MLHKANRWIVGLIIVLLVSMLVLLNTATNASAAQAKVIEVTTNSSCFTCHEDLYYLHDMGKSYCITEHKDRCVNCHEGNATVMSKDKSHVGVIAYPQKDNGAKCKECHKQDTAERLSKFKSLGGYGQIIEAVPYTPSSSVITGTFPITSESNSIAEKIPFVLGATLFFGFWLILVLISPMKP